MNRSSSSSASSISVGESIEGQYLLFIKRTLNRLGNMPLQHLTGHLSQLPFDVREAVGTSKATLMNFLKAHSDIFKVDDKGVVYLLNSNGKISRKKSDLSENSKSSEDSLLPMDIEKGDGSICRLFPKYGFIKCLRPVNTTVYFDAFSFNDENKKLLADFDLKIGQTLGFKAKRGPDSCEAKYRATLVWIIQKDNGYLDDSDNSIKYRKVGTKPNIDKFQKNGKGHIQNVFETYGFISVDNNPKNRVFFHSRTISNYSNISDLRKIFKKGDILEYKAIPSANETSQARWEATQVWVKNKKANHSDEEIFMSSSEDSTLQSEIEHFTSKNENKTYEKKNSKFQYTNNKSSTKALPHKKVAKTIATDKPSISTLRLSNCRGKIFPQENNSCSIKFGENDSKLADAGSAVFYQYDMPVQDVMWEFNDGDNVVFDAVKVKSTSGWKAVLVWTGKKPDISVSNDDTYSENNLDTESSDSEELYATNNGHRAGEKESPSKAANQFNLNLSKTSAEQNINWGDSPLPEKSSVDHPCRNFTAQKGDCGLKKIQPDISETENAACSDDSNFPSSLPEKIALDTKYVAQRIKNTEASENYNSDEASDISVENVETLAKSAIPSVGNEKLQSKEELRKKKSMFNSEIDTKKPKYFDGDDYIHINDVEDYKKEASIKVYQDLSGEISKKTKFCVEIRCKSICKPVIFFWKEFYYDGDHIQENCEDFKAKLNIGDIVKFNCFEIVDDLGCFFAKITLAWIGKKPKNIKEMKPSEFIQQHNLKVSCRMSLKSDDKLPSTLNDISAAIQTKIPASIVDQSESMRHLNTYQLNESSAPPLSSCNKEINGAVPKRKFLSVDTTNLPFPEVEPPLELLQKCAERVSGLLQSCIQHLNGKRLSDCNLEANIDDLSSDIVNMVVSDLHLDQRTPSAICKLKLKEKSCQTDSFLVETNEINVCQTTEFVSNNQIAQSFVNSKSVQTFITGDIISQDLFPQ